MNRIIAISFVVLLFFGCVTEKHIVIRHTPDGDIEEEVDDRDDSDTDAEKARGYRWRKGKMPAPVEPHCPPWEKRVKEAAGECATALFINLCGEKNDDGKATGKYAAGDCPQCDTYTSIRAEKPDGCVEP